MAVNKYVREHLGDLSQEDAEAVVAHLRFLERLEEVVELKNEEPEYGPGDLAERIEWLLHRAKRRQAIDDLAAMQCEGLVGTEQCWFVKGHEGPHKGQCERMDGTLRCGFVAGHEGDHE